MLRQAFAERLKEAMRARDTRTVSTVRLILAALKDRDIAARGAGNPAGIADPEILRLLQGMIKQRRESIALYEQGNRPELARQEGEEIAVIESFLPQQMSDAEIESAARAAIAESGAAGPKDMGRVMAVLRERHAGVLDMGKAGAAVKRLLG
ncbi:MAG TPA: GatB/YqeY domain-containing protein [Stellaceae bacterium]|nr:GatB/YqeY domain-containing protein [Stellaceae bacterium]